MWHKIMERKGDLVSVVQAAVRSLKVRLQEVSAAAAGNHAQVLHMRSMLADALHTRQVSVALSKYTGC